MIFNYNAPITASQIVDDITTIIESYEQIPIVVNNSEKTDVPATDTIKTTRCRTRNYNIYCCINKKI